jgi:predicted transcriptional regulator
MNKTILTILLQEYYSQRDVAKFFKVSQSTVKHYLKKFDLKTRKRKFNIN